jgi:hypothetical protein
MARLRLPRLVFVTWGFRLQNISKLPTRLHFVIGKGARSMVFSSKQDEQRILSEIKECLLQDPRFARLGGHPHQDGALDRLGEYHVAAGIVPEPSPERIKRQAIAQGGGITCDNPSTAPNALAIVQNVRPIGLQNEEIPSDSPSIAPVAPSIDPNPQQPTAQISEVSNDGPSVAKRLFRTGAYGFIITVIVGTAFVWQSSDETTKEMAKGWVNSLVWSSSLQNHNLPPASDVASEAVSTTSDQPLMGNTVILPTASASQPTPTSTATESLPDLKKQFEAIASDLAIVRRIVEQVAARQDQMARDIATLQADEQNVRQKISTLPTLSHHLRRTTQQQ